MTSLVQQDPGVPRDSQGRSGALPLPVPLPVSLPLDAADAARVRGHRDLSVAVIGAGAIGAEVIAALTARQIPGAALAGVVTRGAGTLAARSLAARDFGADLDLALAESDVVVECAGIAAATEYGPRVIARGRSLVLVSIGALAREATRVALSEGPGTLRLASGAIGGLDLLASAARPGGIPDGITRAHLTTTKRAHTLVQPWMSETEAEQLRSATQPVLVFEGAVAEAVTQFPGSLNVACALAHATGLWQETRVRLIADPAAERTRHEIAAAGAAGEYRFEIVNAVSPRTPTSSAVVAESVLRAIAELAHPSGTFV